MAKFIYLYRGPAPKSEPTAEQGPTRMAAFSAWMDKVGLRPGRRGKPVRARAPPCATTAPKAKPAT